VEAYHFFGRIADVGTGFMLEPEKSFEKMLKKICYYSFL
jgi:hypothetical protein